MHAKKTGRLAKVLPVKTGYYVHDVLRRSGHFVT